MSWSGLHRNSINSSLRNSRARPPPRRDAVRRYQGTPALYRALRRRTSRALHRRLLRPARGRQDPLSTPLRRLGHPAPPAQRAAGLHPQRRRSRARRPDRLLHPQGPQHAADHRQGGGLPAGPSQLGDRAHAVSRPPRGRPRQAAWNLRRATEHRRGRPPEDRRPRAPTRPPRPHPHRSPPSHASPALER